jgi:hypothetical protein
MRGAIPPPQRVFMAWCLVKHRDNVTLPLLVTPVENYKGKGKVVPALTYVQRQEDVSYA